MVRAESTPGCLAETLSVLALSSRFDGRWSPHQLVALSPAFSTRSVESF